MRRLGAVLLGIAALVAPALPARGAEPARVTLDGEWQIDRNQHDACFVAVPPTIRGTIHLVADFDAGTVTGWLDGQGGGSYTVPAECVHENPDDYDRSHLETWEAEFTLIRGEFSGDLNPGGTFEVQGTISVEAGAVRDAPGSQWMCGTDYWTDTCIYSYEWEDPVTVAGEVSGTGVNRGGIDWYAPFCAALSPERISWTDEGCPHEGQWRADVTEVVWRENQPPRISDVGIAPEQPTTDDTVVLTAVAHDPDGDELTYRWTVDGSVQETTGASLRLPPVGAGDHWVELVVEDGRGGQAETSLGFTVAAVAVTTTEATSSSTSTTLFGADPQVRPDEQTWFDEASAAWEQKSGGNPLGTGWLFGVLVLAILTGVVSGSLLVGFLVRWKMGWGVKEAAWDAARAEGIEPSPDEDASPLDVLQDAAGQLQGPGGTEVPSTPRSWNEILSTALPPTPPPPPLAPAPAPSPGTPTSYHQARPGLQPGSYRWVEFPRPVALEKPAPGGSVELITTKLTGPVLIGEPDPAFPGHSPAYTQDGKRIGWVRTGDLPG